MLFPISKDRLAGARPDELSDQLEKGRIVQFLDCPVVLPNDADLAFLRDELPSQLLRKNISYYPDADHLVGIRADPEVTARALGILKEYSGRVQRFLSQIMPAFFKGARLGTSSFRPLQERGRGLKPHASNELVHVDAGAYGATHGDRILRFFTNIHPTEDRVWITKGNFGDLYRRHARAAGLASEWRVQVGERWVDRLYSGFVRAASGLVPMAKMIDSSPYDRAMRKFHNYMKDTSAFREDRSNQLEIAFKPFSSWMVLTDAVSHACISGQHALVDTYLVPLANCRLRQFAPYEILKGSAAASGAEL